MVRHVIDENLLHPDPEAGDLRLNKLFPLSEFGSLLANGHQCRSKGNGTHGRSAGLGRTRLCHTWGREPEGGVGRAPAFRVARCQTWTQVGHL